LAEESGESPTKVWGIETGKRPGDRTFGSPGKLARALSVAPEEFLDLPEAVEQQGLVSLSLGWRENRKTGLNTLP